MGRRSAAWVLDLLLFVGLLAGLYALQAEYVEIPAGVGDNACRLLEEAGGDEVASCAVIGDRAYVLSSAEVGYQTFASLGYLAVFIVLQGVTGGSPGKLLTGVRVVDEHGRRPGIGKSLGRTLLWAVDGAPWIVPMVGPIVAFTTTGHRRVGDMAAGTYVVASSSVGEPVRTSAFEPPPAQSAWGARTATLPDGPPPAGFGPPPGGVPPRQTLPEQPLESDLHIRSLDVPAPTDRVDEATPTVHADPDWGHDPSPAPERHPVGGEPPTGPDEPPEAPIWEPPTSPGVDDPIEDWRPPTSPGPEHESPADIGEAPSSPPQGPSSDVETAGEIGRQRADQSPGAPAGGPAPFVPPGGEPEARDTGVSDPWGTGSGGTAGTGGGGGSPARYELPPPQWDQARNTYIQWDPNRAAWLQWDPQRERWKPIDT